MANERNNQLTFRLDTPIEELIPQMIGFNNEELLNKASELACAYSDMVYTEEQIPQAKEDRAKLNNLLKAINAERIRIGKVYNEPYNLFKQKVDEVIDRLQKPIDIIGEQLTEYEAERTARKEADIRNYFDAHIGELGEFVSIDKIFDKKWLNVSVSMKTVRGEIDNAIQNVRNGLATIEALKSDNESTLKVFFFRSLDLGKTLVENERLKEEKRRIDEAAARKTEKAAITIGSDPERKHESEKPAVKLFEVTLAFRDMTLQQANGLLSYIKDNNLVYTRLK